MPKNPSLADSFRRRQSALDAVREPWLAGWRNIAEMVLAQKLRFLDKSNAQRTKSVENTKIMDPRGTIAALRLQALFASGLTSASGPWFRLTTANHVLRESVPVKRWLHAVERRMYAILSLSNVYKVLPHLYFDSGTFGTGAGMFLPKLGGQVIRARAATAGTYWIAQDYEQRLDTYFDRMPATTRQLEQMFGDDLPPSVLSDTGPRAVNAGEQQHTLLHAIEANPDYEPDSMDPARKRFRSYWTLEGQPEWVLGPVSGYDLMPVLAPRWTVYGTDPYGSMSPGALAAVELRALMHQQRRKAQWIDKVVTPPTQSPASMRRTTISLVAGDNTSVPETGRLSKIEPIFEIRGPASWLLEDIADIRRSVEEIFYNDLLLILSQPDGRERTATEVAEIHEEKMLVLAPVIEQHQDDLLDPLIDLLWEYMLQDPHELAALPPLPGQLEGEEIKVEYISILAQAQQAVGTRGLERLSAYVVGLGQAFPHVLDKFDADESVDEYGSMLGVPPGVIVPDEVVASIRKDREARAAAEEREQREMMRAETAQKLGNASVASDTALGMQADALVGAPTIGGHV